MNELGFAEVESRGGFFGPDPSDVALKAQEIARANHEEELATLAALQEANLKKQEEGDK